MTCEADKRKLEVQKAFWQFCLQPSLNVRQDWRAVENNHVTTLEFRDVKLKKYDVSMVEYLKTDERQQNFERALVHFLVQDQQPLSVVTDKGFQTLVKCADKKLNLNDVRTFARGALQHLFRDMREDLKNIWSRDAKGVTFLALTTDTRHCHWDDALFTVSLQYINKDFSLKRWVPCCVSSQQRNVVSKELGKFLTFLPETAKIVNIIHDSARGVQVLSDHGMRPTEDIMCVAHNLEWAIKVAFQECEELKEAKNEALREFPKGMHLRQENKFPSHHWSAEFMRLREVLIWDSMSGARRLLGSKSDKLEELVEVLNPFLKVCEDLSSADTPGSQKVVPCLKELFQHLNTGGDRVAQKFTSSLAKWLCRVEDLHEKVYFEVAYLLDPSHSKTVLGETRWKVATSFLRQKMRDECEPGRESEVDEEMELYINSRSSPEDGCALPLSDIHFTGDVLAWWQEQARSGSLPHLASQAKQFLALPATCGTCQRCYRQKASNCEVAESLFLRENMQKILEEKH